MTQSNGFSNNFVIDSKQIFNKIEADLIRLSQVLQVEYKCSIDESIKNIAKFLITKHNELVSDNTKELINNIKSDIKQRATSRKPDSSDTKILKLFNELGL